MCRIPGTAPLAGGQYPAQGFVSNLNWAGLDDVYNPPLDQAALDLITPSLSDLVGSVGSLNDLGSGADGEEVQQLANNVHAGSPLFSSFPAGPTAGVPSEGRDWLASCLDVARLPAGAAGRTLSRPPEPQPAQFLNAPYLQQPALPAQVKQQCEQRSYNPSLAELQFQLATMKSRKSALDMCGSQGAFDSQTDLDPLPEAAMLAGSLASWRHKKTPEEVEAQTERVKKRRRESARRSRQRKSSYIHSLEEENRLLKVENLELRIKLAQSQGGDAAAAAGQGHNSASASAGSN